MKKKLSLLLAAVLLMSSLSACSSSSDEEEVVDDEVVVESVYATMNIPYADFYAAEISSETEVDAVTSATTSKWSMFTNTYYTETETGGVINGPAFPVLISQELFDEYSALAEDADYYVSALDAEPVLYKEVTVDDAGELVFSEVITEAVTVIDAEVSMTYPSSYGDFQLAITSDDLPADGKLVYGATVVTESGKSYGLRSLENIWFTSGSLSWGMGYKTTESHGNTLSSEHYADMQGETIVELNYYVEEGIISVPMDIYVPVLFTSTWYTLGEASGSASYEAMSVSINYIEGVEAPADFEKTLMVKDSSGAYIDGFTASDDFTSISWTSDIAPGSYTVEIVDANGVYMPYAVSLVLQTSVIPVSFDAASLSFVADNGASDEDVAAYLTAISSYTVLKDGEEEATSYNVSENHGTPGTPLLTDDMTIDLAGVDSDEEAVYEAGATYTVTFTVTGYVAYSITFVA